MILSFSLPEMLPMIRAGIRECAGQDVGVTRVKRQTIRLRGPRAEKLLAFDPICHSVPYKFDLWWKSRTRERDWLGNVGFPKVYPINILHSFVEPPDAPKYPVCRIDGPRGWRNGDATLFWSPGDGLNGFVLEARRDGFDSAEAFRDFFVPNMGDRFDAIIFKW